MLLVVLIALILLNEFARRTKFGGCFMFFGVPAARTLSPAQKSNNRVFFWQSLIAGNMATSFPIKRPRISDA